MEKEPVITLIDAFKDFKEEKSIDRPVMMGVLKDVFLTQLAKTYGSSDNFDVIVNVDKGTCEIYQNFEIVEEVTNPAAEMTLEQVKEALEAGADIIMLDNMDNETMKKAVEMIDGRAQTECSGNVTKQRLREIAEIGVDFVSCGALTHSAPIMDVSLKNLTVID